MKKILSLIALILVCSCSTSSDGNGNSNTSELPTLTTAAVSTIAPITAASGGTISSDGGAAITAKGVCWSTSANPTISLTTKTNDGSGSGTFISNMTGLAANTIYYVRAYATNSLGTAYGNEISFTTANTSGTTVTDIDGNSYQSITICSQTLTKQNLNVSKYSDGTPIPQVQDTTAWANLTTGAWCYYENNTANGAVCGKLYNWYAVAGIYDAASATNPALRKKLAPNVWHVPTDGEWSTLINCLDPNADGGNNFNTAGGKMKTTGTLQDGTGLWNFPNAGATNESGFSGLPAGFRNYDGTFSYVGNGAIWWSSSESEDLTTEAWGRGLNFYTYGAARPTNDKTYGFSVRCLRN